MGRCCGRVSCNLQIDSQLTVLIPWFSWNHRSSHRSSHRSKSPKVRSIVRRRIVRFPQAALWGRASYTKYRSAQLVWAGFFGCSRGAQNFKIFSGRHVCMLLCLAVAEISISSIWEMIAAFLVTFSSVRSEASWTKCISTKRLVFVLCGSAYLKDREVIVVQNSVISSDALWLFQTDPNKKVGNFVTRY